MPLLDTMGVARHCGYSRRTVERGVHRGLLAWVGLPGAKRFTLAAVEAWLAAESAAVHRPPAKPQSARPRAAIKCPDQEWARRQLRR